MHGGVVGDRAAELRVRTLGRVLLADVECCHRESVIGTRVLHERQRVDRLIVTCRAITGPANDPVSGNHGIDLNGARMVGVHTERIPLILLCIHLIGVEQKDREVRVVAGKVGTRRLRQVPRGVAARGCPCGLLTDVPALLNARRARGLRIPEMAARLGVGIGGRANETVRVDPRDQVLDVGVARCAKDEARKRDHVHHVDHSRRGAAVAGECFRQHQDANVILAAAAILLWHDCSENAELGERLDVRLGIGARAIADDRLRTNHSFADLNQPLLDGPLIVGQKPLGLPLAIDPAVWTLAPLVCQRLRHTNLRY